MLNVFVSSTVQDLASYRTEARELIQALGLTDIAMERWGADDRPPKERVEQALQESHVFVGILAWRYGSRIEPDGVSYTEYEYRLARQGQLPCLIFLSHPKGMWSMECVDKGGADAASIDALRKEICEGGRVTCKFFSTPLDLVRWLSASLMPMLSRSRAFRDLGQTKQAILRLRHRIQEDFVARRQELETQAENRGRQWFVAGMNRCNVGPRYIPRAELLDGVAGWLVRGESPYLLLLGPSGIGKTNFLIDFIRHAVGETTALKDRSPLLFPLGTYDPEKPFLRNLEEFVSTHGGQGLSGTSQVIGELLSCGDVLLVLDGLDEFARNHGEQACAGLLMAVREAINPQRSRVIISCRDHIYQRLLGKGLFGNWGDAQILSVPWLTQEQVATAIQNRLGVDSPCYYATRSFPVLLGFARNPLLLEMMCRISRESWKRLVQEPTTGRLYDLWFQEIVAAGEDPQEFLRDEFIEDTQAKVGLIAGLMLKARSDLIAASVLKAHDLSLPYLRTLTRRPFGILVQQTSDEWGFVHDSFREFALARTVATELTSREYKLLAATSSFDYVAAETYGFLRDLLPTDQRFMDHIDAALSWTEGDHVAWNNIVRNCFEAVGSIGEESAERFIDKAVQLLLPAQRGQAGAADLATYKTKYNIVLGVGTATQIGATTVLPVHSDPKLGNGALVELLRR